MIDIRSAREEDSAFIIASQIRMAAETEGVRLDRATVERGVRAVFDDPAKGRYYLAELDGEPAGCLLTIPEWSDWRNGTVLWIHSLYVSPEHRRRGVFQAFYDHLRKMVATDESLRGLRLYVDKTNTGARKTYEAMGMDGGHYQTFEWMKQLPRSARL